MALENRVDLNSLNKIMLKKIFKQGKQYIVKKRCVNEIRCTDTNTTRTMYNLEVSSITLFTA